MKYNLIIVDDHVMFLDGLQSIFESIPEYNILLATSDGSEILKYIENNKTQKIDLIITDITMPKLDGISLNKAIKQKKSAIKTLIVSMHINAEMIAVLIHDNVDGYVPKNAEKEELCNAIEIILKGEKYFSKEIKDMYLESKLSNKKKELVKLTQREKQVVTLIAQEFTTQEIADTLFLSKHTIESYRKNLMLKLDVRNIAGLTKYALRMNYLAN
ncbi:response regulator transcription factor [Tenacibaculum finnmarkense genomovar ulcerans]|uniref:response regulator n=1 Tax=Tenacibaculum finnmarkense TaxID=2781243 RepID=UPI001E4AFA55|nr:response regulator transcription factor [Tenacibaculum finnmarkense]MCD8454314.1 response regulator transcription factor [Tenacibaculum finnmarkense genomovar ulcerans]